MSCQLFLDQCRALIEQRLDTLLCATGAPIIDAARYSLLGSGKRLRPLLTLATTEALGTPYTNALDIACAIEIIHTYSLIHDDLPCMDDDDFRRGKPSLHKAYGEATAVLAGDLLLTKAFEIIAQDSQVSAPVKIEIIGILAQQSGDRGLIGGQCLDMAAEGKKLDESELEQIHRYKTGALISGAVVSGALIGGASAELCAQLESFGYRLGLAFQILDDVLDVTGGTAKRGDTKSSDIVNNKTTYVTLMGVPQAEQRAIELLRECGSILDSLGFAGSALESLSTQLIPV